MQRSVSDFLSSAASDSSPAQLNSTTGLALVTGAALTMGFGYYLTRGGNGQSNVNPLVDPERQSRILPDGSRVCSYMKSDELVWYMFEDSKTIYQGVRRGARISKNGPMLGRRVVQPDGSMPYRWLHYDEVLSKAENLAYGFRELGIPAGNDVMIGIYCKNRPEWIMTELATYNYSNVIVPIYETLGFEACVYILNQAEISMVVCDESKKAVGLLKQKSSCPGLRFLVVMDEISDELRVEASAFPDVRVLGFEELVQIGANAINKPPHQPPEPDHLATICYTSGTTGTPKGVMLTHKNVVADVTCIDYFKNSNFNMTDSMMSFLPLAHMFERIIELACYQVGAKVGFYRGDIRTLTDDIKELRPTILPVVPRVLNRLYDKVMGEVKKSYIKKTLFNVALAYKSREMSKFIVRNDGFFDNLVFKKIREAMGGRVKLMVTGSAPLAENVLTFVRAAMGCIVVEGYGQTECVAACTVSMEGDSKAGHVGMVIPSCKIKLVDAPELGYFAKDNAGEVCIKGNIVFKGYYKNEELTREVLDSDGWLHTGDVGKWTKEGTLKIVDRKKHILKLQQGEYVAPEKIENIYVRSQFVAQSFVYGESLKTCLIAVVVPDPEVLVPYAEKELNLKASIEELCQNEKVKQLITADMIAVGKKAGLFSFEQVKDVFLCPDMFTVENDLLTPTLKSKRPKLKDHFRTQLQTMYSKLD
ncbi:hypothetical protein WR25_22503 [Diploscapter pachys]|uniref:Long-chain-fatty-acid--CoA ligase n=1 Tax=Diploscapter pachys TaxID=2018661 RepID=A0A2A2JXM4_9BILA|nr:hypothetical protein WR25_22503 [Diploscapter pachys]